MNSALHKTRIRQAKARDVTYAWQVVLFSRGLKNRALGRDETPGFSNQGKTTDGNRAVNAAHLRCPAPNKRGVAHAALRLTLIFSMIPMIALKSTNSHETRM
jgi:hypothetical protein